MDETLAVQGSITPALAEQQPLYQRIAADLRARIRNQEFAAGAYLPTEERLCAYYQVSRFTIREALRQLQTDGLITRRRGAGTLIQHDGAAITPPAPEEALAADAGQFAPGRFGGSTTLIANERLAQRLGCAPGSRWLVRSAVQTTAADGTPTGLVEFYLSPTLARLAGKLQPGAEPMWQQLRQLGQPVEQTHLKVQSVTPVQTEARVLKIAALSPCLRLTYACRDPENTVVAIATHLHPGHSFAYETVLKD